MTKAITSTAVMQLVEKGKIDLDSPIEEYLPEINQIKILNKDLSKAKEIPHNNATSTNSYIRICIFF